MQIRFTERTRTLGTFDAVGIVGLVGFFVARFIPVARLPFWGCVLRETTGWPCLGCGLTRVADRFSHGNLAGAWDANPLGTVGAAVFLVICIWTLLHLAFRVPTPIISFGKREALAFKILAVVLVLVNYGFVLVKAKFPYLLG